MSTQALVCTGIVMAVMAISSYSINRVKRKAEQFRVEVADKLAQAKIELIEAQIREDTGQEILKAAYADFERIDQVLKTQTVILRQARTDLETALPLLSQTGDSRIQVAYNRVGRTTETLDELLKTSVALRDRLNIPEKKDAQA
ncbi:hypothetical protein JT27_18180 [Alcaligenes faecalis]|uniref:hypothetical protein n=1 Tax=Alcaligenes faecalis TaxID=511 RepID=UPI00052BAB6E|nr:hypothetical protein [Alcaligenes faecalis]KGP00262.1 hypothetical protein JT27_18180 [Alcaligenes faecalis]